jgi:hypothetical protein
MVEALEIGAEDVCNPTMAQLTGQKDMRREAINTPECVNCTPKRENISSLHLKLS